MPVAAPGAEDPDTDAGELGSRTDPFADVSSPGEPLDSPAADAGNFLGGLFGGGGSSGGGESSDDSGDGVPVELLAVGAVLLVFIAGGGTGE